jgi:hypothetical protein
MNVIVKVEVIQVINIKKEIHLHHNQKIQDRIYLSLISNLAQQKNN